MDADGNVLAINENAKSMVSENDITPVLLKASTIKDDNSCLTETIEDEEHMYLIIARPMKDKEGKVVGSVASIRVSNL